MKSTYMLALAMLAVLVFAGGAYADRGDYDYSSVPGFGYPGNTYYGQPVPSGAGAGPSCVWPNCPSTPAPNSCNVTPTGQCGAFCAGGQQAPGWPYNWCSEYWLRPNSNL